MLRINYLNKVMTTREAHKPLLKPVRVFPAVVGSPSPGLVELYGIGYS